MIKSKPVSAAPAPTFSWRVFLLIAPLCWLLYANSLGNAFVFDDLYTVVNNDLVRNFSLGAFLNEWYRPLRDLSLAFDHWLWGLNPSGFRLTNIMIHSANSCLVYLLALHLAKQPQTALLTALVFATHPLQTDAVAYISGRRDVLFAFFYLLSLYAFIRYRQTERPAMAIGSLVAFALSLLTKEMAVTLPLIVLLWDFHTRWESHEHQPLFPALLKQTWDVLKANRWLVLTGLLIGLVVIGRQIGQGRGLGSPRALRFEYWGGSFWTNFLTVLTVHAHYLKLLLAPVTLIASYQDAFPLAQSLWQPRVLIAIIVLLGVAGVMLYGFKRDKLIGFAIAFYLITLLPVSQIIPHHELMAEHYLYLPLFGYALLFAHLVVKLAAWRPTWKWAIYALAGLVIIALSARTILRNRDWKDSFTLWSVTYRAVPHSTRAVYNLGVEYMKKNQVDQAIPLLERAIELNPNHVLAYNNLAAAYLAKGEPQRALALLQHALTLKPDNRDRIVWAKRDQTYRMILRNIAKSYLALNQPARALEYVRQALDISPNDPSTYALQALIYQKTGQPEAALQACQQGLQLDPSSVELRTMMAELLESQGRMEDAQTHWEQLLSASPTHPAANIRLAVSYINRDQVESAAQHLRQAFTQPITQPQLNALIQQATRLYPPPRSFLLAARLYHLIQETEQAIVVCQQGLEQFPRDRDLRNQLAFLYADSRQLDKAAAEWNRVLQIAPNDFLANLNLGSYHLNKRDPASAQKYLDIALANAADETSRQRVLEILTHMKNQQADSSSSPEPNR
ncbi:MAG: tetratricopeptide repeat protein [Acidobacteriota bacterium]|nr:tetratricopeptide repeat protein [Acidobacteriota bacterium]